MKKLSLVFVVFLLMAFTSTKVEENLRSDINTSVIQKDILEYENVIEQKQEKISNLEIKAAIIFKNNSEETVRILEEVNRLKFVCLKYEAAIATRKMYLDEK